MPLAPVPLVAALTQLLVGPAGSGAPFTDIQAAVDAAAPGDTILVLPGTYSPFDVDRPLTIVGSGPGVTEVRSDAPAGSGVIGVVASVHDVGAGARVTLSGLRFNAPVPVIGGSPLVSIRDCDAAVQLHDVEIAWSPPGGGVFAFTGWQLELANAAFVQLDEVLVDAPGGAGGDGIRADGSTLWLSNSTVRGGATQSGSAAVVALGSDVLVAASTLLGADTDHNLVTSCGSPGFIDLLCDAGGPGLVLAGGSTLRVHGLATDVIDGGEYVGLGLCDCGGEDGASIAIGAGASATLFGGPALGAAVTVEPGGALAESPLRAATLALTPSAAAPGGGLTATVATEPATPVFLYGALPTTVLVPVVGFDPGAALPLASIVPLGFGQADGTGSFIRALSLPGARQLAGSVLAAQAVVAGALPGTSNAALVRIDF